MLYTELRYIHSIICVNSLKSAIRFNFARFTEICAKSYLWQQYGISVQSIFPCIPSKWRELAQCIHVMQLHGLQTNTFAHKVLLAVSLYWLNMYIYNIYIYIYIYMYIYGILFQFPEVRNMRNTGERRKQPNLPLLPM